MLIELKQLMRSTGTAFINGFGRLTASPENIHETLDLEHCFKKIDPKMSKLHN